jgi:hypothetical protein
MLGAAKTHSFFSDRTTTGASDKVRPLGSKKTFHAFGNTTAGAGAAAVKIQVSNDGTNWIDHDTLSLTLATTVSSDSFETDTAWAYVRANVDSISGTGAKVSVIMGAQ